jgi:hypothetical protein
MSMQLIEACFSASQSELAFIPVTGDYAYYYYVLLMSIGSLIVWRVR